MKKITFLLLCCFLSGIQLFAQQEDITGMWNGELLLTDSAGELVHLPYEIAVSEAKGKLKGYSRIVFHANGKDEAGVQDITIEKKGNVYIMEDEGFIDHQFSINPSSRVKKTMNVQLTVTEKEMILEGGWSTNKTRRYTAMKGTVFLKRKNDFKKSELFRSLDTLKLAADLSFKDRPSLPDNEPTVAVITPEKKPAPVVVDEKEPETVPDLVIPAIGSTTASLAPLNTKPWPMRNRVQPVARPKKMQMDLLAKSTMKPKPVAAKPEPVVVAAVTPKPKPEKPAPVRKDPDNAPVPEKKPEPVAVKPAPPKSTPPPLAYVAPSATGGAAELDKRVTKSDQSFYFDNDSLVLTLYDNGEVDGDTVTVIMNGNVIFSKAGLSTKPNTKTVYITQNMDSVKLVMYAESLGEIPPNTGLLIVNDGEKRYDVRFSADLNTNAAIVLKRRKNQ